MLGVRMDEEYVSVKGPHGRHIEVLASIQRALPDAFPLADDGGASASSKKTVDSKEGA